jgi:hypothetical protein
MAIKKGLTDEQIVSEIETALKGYNLGDIKTVCENKLTIAGFILCGCLIDHIAGFRYERETNNGKVTGSQKRYVDFVNTYMAKYGYDGKVFYEQLRCQVVHAYTSSDKTFAFDLMHSHKEEQRKSSEPVNRQRLDLETFVKQLEEVLTSYLNEIKNNKQIRDIAIKNYKQFGIFSENP